MKINFFRDLDNFDRERRRTRSRSPYGSRGRDRESDRDRHWLNFYLTSSEAS